MFKAAEHAIIVNSAKSHICENNPRDSAQINQLMKHDFTRNISRLLPIPCMIPAWLDLELIFRLHSPSSRT